MSTQLTPAMRRSALIAALRDPNLRPDGFEWDFTDCRSCAVGMFQRLMPAVQRTNDEATDTFMARALGMSEADAHSTFVSAWPAYRCSHTSVTPSMVADRLERLHKELVE